MVMTDAWIRRREEKYRNEGQKRHSSYSGEVNGGLCYVKDVNGERASSLRW